jgi:anti-sigma-K factor RskA
VTREHDALRDLIAPVALGAADPTEIARVEAHATECAVCREELTSLRGSADVLAVAVPQHSPRPELKASIMDVVRAEAAARAPQPAAPTPAPARRRSWLPSLGLRPALAVLGALAALLVGWNIALQVSDDPERDQVTAIQVTGTEDAPGVTGSVVYVPDEDTAVVRLSRLPALDEDEAYQLWVLRDGEPPRSAGLFQATGPSDAQRVATGLRGADALAVTAQPRTSRTTPEGPILVQAALETA